MARARTQAQLPEQNTAPDRAGVERAARDLLVALGFSPNDPALRTTPRTVARALVDGLLDGYKRTPAAALGEGFPASGASPVVATNLPLLFVCPHHLLPALAVAHVAIAPRARVPGLGRVARLLDTLGRRLVLQEDLTEQAAGALVDLLDARAALVIIEARHGCVAAEDLARAEASFRTRAARGPRRLVESLASEIDASLDLWCRTSASKPASAAPTSRSPSPAPPSSARKRRKPTTSR